MHAKTILLATDLSPASTAALPQAARLAWTFDAEVVVATIGSATELDADEHRSLRTLEAFRETLTQMDVRVRTVVIEGSASHPEDALLQTAAREGADLLVLTRHGERAEAGRVGSTTIALARRAPMPVLVAHGPASHNPSELVRPSPWRKLLAATDFSAAAKVTTQRAAALAERLHGTLELLTVLVDARCALDIGPDHVHFAKLPSDLNTWAKQSEEHLAALCEALAGTVEQRVVAAEDAAPAIVAAALQDGVDLVVVAAGSKGPLETLLLGSTTESVLRLSPLPVLVLRGKV